MSKGGGRYRKGGGYAAADIISSVLLAVFIITFSVTAVVNFRALYYADVVALNIPAVSGMSTADIKRNYDALIAYNSLFYRGDLIFPTLPMSEGGRIHFAEVKRIFDVIQILAMGSGVGLAVMFIAGKAKGRIPRCRRGAGLICILLPAVLGLLSSLFWDRFFVIFHHIFFRNDYWLFDPATDPVILMLPDGFFFHALAAILVLVIGGGLLCLISDFRSRRNPA